MRRNVSINTEQEKAINSLRRALKKCESANVYLWDDYGTISAVNGDIVLTVCPDSSLDDKLENEQVFSIFTSCWHACNADDQLYVKYR